MEGELLHIHHEGFTEHNRKLSGGRKWVAFSIFVVAAFLYSVPSFTLCVPILTFMIRWYPRPVILFINYAIGRWLTITIWLLEVLLDIKVRTFGDTFDHLDHRSLLIMNHRTHLDWLFLWSVVGRYGNLDCWKPIMKSSLKQVPLYGWAMQYALHIFVNRQWRDDKEELRNKLQIYNILNLPIQVLLFPGGGDLTLKTKTLSDQYADKKGLPHYNYVLQPHLRGFLYIINILRSHKLNSIVDITVAYPDALPKTELHFVKGHIPREVYYYVKCYPLNTLPDTDEGLCQWLRTVWSDKEERLKYFYTHRQFPDGEQQLEKHGSISAIYQTILFFIATIVIAGVMLYYSFYTTMICVIVAVGWLVYRVTREGGIDKLLLNEIYKQVNIKSFDYEVPEQLVN